MPGAELDLRLHRLLFVADGVYAIAVTLLAVELVLPEAAADLRARSTRKPPRELAQGARLPDQLRVHRQLLGRTQHALLPGQALRRRPDVAGSRAALVHRLLALPHFR